MSCALADSGRHQITAYTIPVGEEVMRRWGSQARRVRDVEELLADPAIEAVIVASDPNERPLHLRRAVQSERHVLCVHPPDDTPEIAYEAAMMQKDTDFLLMPLLPEALHPAFRRLTEFVRRPVSAEKGADFPGAFRLLEIERGAAGAVLDGLEIAGRKPTFPGWDVLHQLGGEISEVSGFAEEEDPPPDAPVVLSGRFQKGGLFQMTLLPFQPDPRWRFTLIGAAGRAELLFPLGWEGPAFLDWRDASGETHEESWDPWEPWPTLVEVFESAWKQGTQKNTKQDRLYAESDPQPLLPSLTWQDSLRALELDDAARRSIERRRANLLEYPEANEEVGFKGTMTLAGCGLFWGVLLLLFASAWIPWAGWLIIPLLILFLFLQLLRLLIPRTQTKK
jgi:predicted dehydrogenase